MRQKTSAALFALLGGGIGLHKFYLGDVRKGITYLLLCWTLVPGIIAFIEGLIFLSMSYDKFDKEYN